MTNPAPAPEKLPAITAPDCAEEAAAALRRATMAALGGVNGEAATRAEALVKVAAGWRELGVALDQHYGLNRDTDDNKR